jgi:hypothetical protein
MGVVQTYPLRVAAEAAQIPERTGRRWIDNHVITLGGIDSRTTGSGNHCGWSRNRIEQAATMEILLKSGMSLSRAAKAALKFTDEGQTGRAPGQLFEHGKTMLVISGNGASVKNCFFDATLADVSNREISITSVDMNKVVDQVDSVLERTNTK